VISFKKLAKTCSIIGIFIVLVLFCVSLKSGFVFANCTKEKDCFSCHSSQELRKVHKDCQYLKEGCISCHKLPEAPSTDAREGNKPCVCPQERKSSEAEGSKYAEIKSEIQIGHEDWEKLQRTVYETVEKHLVGRKFLEIYGPLGAGVQCVPLDTYAIPSWATIDMLGESDSAIHSLKRDIAHIPVIYKDFWLFWRDIEASKKCETPLDASAAVGAAIAAAAREDDLVFNGLAEMGMAGFLNVNGRNILKLSDWTVIGNGFQDVVLATEKLRSLGFFPPYALVVSPRLYALLHKVYERTGQLEIKGVSELVKGGVYQSPTFKKDVALVVAMGRQNVDIAVGTNFKVEYWGPQNLNHRFRVVGSSVLRIKCPQAICTLE
jgi:uncharacterized linocin/CFP29 family protein